MPRGIKIQNKSLQTGESIIDAKNTVQKNTRRQKQLVGQELCGDVNEIDALSAELDRQGETEMEKHMFDS
jgi:hypothetical protein